jgi:hypothetical protein
VSAWKFRKSKDVALYSNYAFRRLNTRVSVFSFYEAATDAIFPPLDLVEFSLEFGCGSQLKLRDDFICVEIDAHDGDLEVKFAGWLPLNSTPARADQRHGFQSARAARWGPGSGNTSRAPANESRRASVRRAKPDRRRVRTGWAGLAGMIVESTNRFYQEVIS